MAIKTERETEVVFQSNGSPISFAVIGELTVSSGAQVAESEKKFHGDRLGLARDFFAHQDQVEEFAQTAGGRLANFSGILPYLPAGIDANKIDPEGSFRYSFANTKLEVVGIKRTRNIGEQEPKEQVFLTSIGVPTPGLDTLLYNLTDTGVVRYSEGEDKVYGFVYPLVHDGPHGVASFIEIGKDDFGFHRVSMRGKIQETSRAAHTKEQLVIGVASQLTNRNSYLMRAQGEELMAQRRK